MPAADPERLRANSDIDALLADVRALVAADTRNPPGGERLAADVARQILEPLGASFEEVEPEPDRTSLVASIGPCDGERPLLVVNGHLDVVPIDPSGWSRDPFGGELDGDRLYGRGTADMKGGIAAAIEALRILDRAGIERPCDVAFHLVADEERGGALGAAVLVEQGFASRAHACLVPEPTGLDVCVAERGILVADVTTHGRPAHASRPRDGVSAIEHAAHVVLALHGAEFGVGPHPLLGSPTANAGVIAGGSGHNTVAERCTVTIDRRVLPGETAESAASTLRARIDERLEQAGLPDVRYDVDVETFGEASELDPSHPFATLVASSVTAARGAAPSTIGMPFATDARFVRNQAGVPAVVCGPGGIEQAHVHDEWVSLASLVEASVAFAHLMASFDDDAVAALARA